MSGLKRLCCGLLLLILFAAPIAAQTLARPGWAGSGLASDAWWHTAVFYAIQPDGFQASGDGSVGDLRGIAQRMDYLQSLGVDAIVLEPPFKDDGFDDLLSEASRRHVRIVIALDRRFSASGNLLAEARSWLTRGAAGIFLRGDSPEPLLPQLRPLINSFPGQRVLLAEHAAVAAATGGRRRDPQNASPDLVALQVTEANDNAGVLHQRLEAGVLATSPPLLTEGPNRQGNGIEMFGKAKSSGIDAIIAAMLLTSRGAVSLLYGQEIGMSEGTHIGPQTMQWTPSNITPPTKAEEPVEEAKPVTPPRPDVYGAFVPYVAPKKIEQPATAKVDPNSLRGFTSGKLPDSSEVTNNDSANVAVEDADPKSLLNFYRRLIQLHHDNSSLRSGTPYVLNHDAESALVWLRRAPAGSVTAATVVIACNLSDKMLTLSLDGDFAQLHMHTGSLRPLAASWTAVPIAQYSNHIVLPPYSVFIGELYHH
jgi:Alpha amylase, catalytic domain